MVPDSLSDGSRNRDKINGDDALLMEYKPNIDAVLKRYEAFWQKEVYDRPPIRGPPPLRRRKPTIHIGRMCTVSGRISSMTIAVQLRLIWVQDSWEE